MRVDKIQSSACVGTRDCVIWFILATHIKTPATNSKQSKSGWLINYSDWFTVFAYFMFWLCCCWFIAQRQRVQDPWKSQLWVSKHRWFPCPHTHTHTDTHWNTHTTLHYTHTHTHTHTLNTLVCLPPLEQRGRSPRSGEILSRSHAALAPLLFTSWQFLQERAKGRPALSQGVFGVDQLEALTDGLFTVQEEQLLRLGQHVVQVKGQAAQKQRWGSEHKHKSLNSVRLELHEERRLLSKSLTLGRKTEEGKKRRKVSVSDMPFFIFFKIMAK